MSEKKELPVCIRCHRTGGEKDRFCISCGAPLINRCSDEPGLVSKGCRHVNLPDASYCARCGEETTFKKAGLLTPFPQKKHHIRID